MFTRYDARRDKLLVLAIYAATVGLMVVFLYPFWDQFVVSLSSRSQSLTSTLHLFAWPISLSGYENVVTSSQFLVSLGNSLRRTIVGTAWTLFVTALAAYPLSRPNCPFRRVLTGYILFTMIFNGGLIPGYLLRKSLGLIDKFLVLILPGIGAYNVIIMRNFFQSIPNEIQEAAKIDGASDLAVFWHIALPLSKPVLATVALWTAVAHWNAYFDVLIYITNAAKYTLPIVLRRVLIEAEMESMDMLGQTRPGDLMRAMERPTAETVKAALLIVSTLPILLVYPLLQRYFVKGIMLGSLKG